MSYQVLARKWRPKRFQDVVGQDHIVKSLQNALLKEKLGHAYILTGTRGIGKTSVARIFAKALCCAEPMQDKNPCGKCTSCQSIDTDSSLDVLEIDGASNNGVDNIRSLIENIQYLPLNGKYKVYIIDEVHMLSKGAFNALLKTLEEPPAHVIFIFATTEPEQLLGTVLSRCQRFEFRQATILDLAKHIGVIAKSEGITFESPKLIEKLAHLGRGSVRDTLSLFDQVLSFSEGNRVSEETMVRSLGLARTELIETLLYSVLAGDTAGTRLAYQHLLHENVELKNILSSLLDALYDLAMNIDHPEKRDVPVKKITATFLEPYSVEEIFWIYESLAKDSAWVLTSLNPVGVSEMMLLKITKRRDFFTPQKKSLIEPKEKIEIPEVVPVAGPKEETKTQTKSWDEFLRFLKERSPALYSNLLQGNITEGPVASDGQLIFKMAFTNAGQIFKDYLEEREVFGRFKDILAEYYEIPVAGLFVSFELFDDEKRKERSFITKAEEVEIIREAAAKNTKDEILNNPMIKVAEKMFNTKIDKVILKEEK